MNIPGVNRILPMYRNYISIAVRWPECLEILNIFPPNDKGKTSSVFSLPQQ